MKEEAGRFMGQRLERESWSEMGKMGEMDAKSSKRRVGGRAHLYRL